MKLYGSLTSPYVRKVRVILIEKGIDYEFIMEAHQVREIHPKAVRKSVRGMKPESARKPGERS